MPDARLPEDGCILETEIGVVDATLETQLKAIEALEAEQASLRTTLADPQIYAQDNARALALHARDAEIEAALMLALERWEALSSQ